eukprot:UC1_evm1s1259
MTSNSYMLFYDNVCSNVVLNLNHTIITPNHGVIESYGADYLVKFALCLDLTFSYPLVLAPARELVERSLIPTTKMAGGAGGPPGRWTRVATVSIRIILVLLTVAIAQIKRFGDITNLVGGFSLSTLAFITPPLIWLKMFGGETRAQQGLKGKCKILGTILLL